MVVMEPVLAFVALATKIWESERSEGNLNSLTAKGVNGTSSDGRRG